MYYTEVALQAKISGRVDTVRFETNFYVDATEPDAGAAFKKLSVFLPEIGAHEVFNGIESGEELESVVVPKDGIYQMVQFVSESYGQKGMFDVWLSGSDESPLIINSNIIGFANDGSEAHIVYDYNEYVYPTVFVSDDEPTILYIRERLVNGETGPVKQLNLSVSEYAPELEVEVVPDGVSQSVGLRAKKSSSMNGSLKDFYMLQNGMPYDVEVTEEGLLSIDGKTEFNEPQTMSFLLVDEYGIYSYYPDAVDLSEYLDNDAPTLSSRILSSTDDGYEVEINLNDAMVRSSGDNLKLYLSPTNPAAGDGSPGNAADADSDILAITWSEGDELEFGSSPNSAGIYGMTPAEGADSIYTVSDDGHSFKAVISGKVPETGDIIAYAVDEAGNKSAPYNILEGIDAEYAAPEITGMSRADDGSLELEFSSGVKIVSPAGANADMTYSDVKTGIPIYSDGVYDITFEDIFGDEHTQTIEVALDGDLKLNVEMTPQTRTNQNVMFNISSAREDELLTITGCTLAEGTAIGYDIAEDGQSAQITATENCVFRITLSYGGNEYERTFTVDNIDRSAEAAVTWEYEKDVTGTETLGSVTAIVYPLDYDDELTGTNGALTHTFTSGSIGDTYTFEYTDQAGNSGSVTAELPVDIIIPEPVRLSYTMELFGSTNSLTMPMGTYIYNEKEPFDFGKLTDSQRDVISIDTNVDAKMLILPAGTSAEDVTDDTQSAAIEGAALSGNTVTVTENTEFVIALIASDTVENYDENAPRVIIIPVKLSNIRTLGEVGLVYANLNRYTRRVYFDPKGQEITITNSSGIGIEEEHSQYKGYHCLRLQVKTVPSMSSRYRQ